VVGRNKEIKLEVLTSLKMWTVVFWYETHATGRQVGGWIETSALCHALYFIRRAIFKKTDTNRYEHRVKHRSNKNLNSCTSF
jgi:hypothetical protein